MRVTPRQAVWRVLFFVFLAANIAGWIWLYAQFLRYFFLEPNPFRISLSLLQWLPALGAAVFILPRMLASDPHPRRGWFFLALALLLWVIGDLSEYLLPVFLGASALPVSRFAHVAAFVLAFAAIFLFSPIPPGRFGRLRFLLDLVIQGSAWGVLLWFLVVQPTLQPAAALTEGYVWMAAYAILDLILLMLILWVQGQSRRPRFPMWLLAGGFFFISIYDLVTGWIAGQGAAHAYIWTGFLLLGGYTLIIGAAVVPEQPRLPEDSSAAEPEGRGLARLRLRWQRLENRWLPPASALALAVFLFAQWGRSGTLDPLLLLGTIIVSLLLFLREGVIAGQAETIGYAVLLENLEDPVFICTAVGGLTLENSALRALLPAKRGSRRLVDLIPVHPEWPHLLREAAGSGWKGEIIVESAARKPFPAWLVLQRLPREEGQPERFAGLLHDLSPQRRQEESLRAAFQQAEESRLALEQLSAQLEERVRQKTADLSRALDQLEEQNRLLRSLDRLKSDFIALTSHELRTPLAGIRAGVELTLSRRPPVPQDARANLELVQHEAERLTRFVERILDLSAFEAGRLPLQVVPLRIRVIWEAVRTALASAHGGPDGASLRRLQVDLVEDLPEVMADEHILASVLFQLIDNAIKYSAEGIVQVDAVPAPDWVDVVIRDHGPGIPADQRDQLFRMFTRLEDADTGRAGGVGLGLYISRKMVEAMAGSLELLPVSEGLALRLRLPRSPEES
jgi:signal transduction histidine kinase